MSDEKIDKNQLVNSLGIVLSAFVIAGAIFYSSNGGRSNLSSVGNSLGTPIGSIDVSNLEEAVIPSEGVLLPVSWGDLGARLVKEGVIDMDKFEAIYANRGGLSEENRKMLANYGSSPVRITRENAPYLLNLFWALGLGNKNPILDSGEMSDPANGGAGNFASTGGWTISTGEAMSHYSRHRFVELTSPQQGMVDRVSKNIYRPCCGNSTHFPDCNHGMAMLGLLELMASQGVSEEEMYRIALAVNSYWFPDTYLTLAEYMQNRGIVWGDISPKEILGANYSSGSGFANIKAQVVKPGSRQGGGGCGV